MALMMGARYDALRKADIEDDIARKAAEEVAAYDNGIERLEGKVTLLQWMVGFNLAISTAVLFRVLS